MHPDQMLSDALGAINGGAARSGPSEPGPWADLGACYTQPDRFGPPAAHAPEGSHELIVGETADRPLVVEGTRGDPNPWALTTGGTDPAETIIPPTEKLLPPEPPLAVPTEAKPTPRLSPHGKPSGTPAVDDPGADGGSSVEQGLGSPGQDLWAAQGRGRDAGRAGEGSEAIAASFRRMLATLGVADDEQLAR